jgi:hypothetical protein
VDLFLSSEKGKPGLNKLSLGVEEDRSVAAVGQDPERRTGYGAIHFHCHLNWIEKVAVAVDDELDAVILAKRGGVKFMWS